MAGDSKRYHDALKKSLANITQPHPLEVLGFTPELVRTYDPPALLIAARGLARAHQMVLHPDHKRSGRGRKPVDAAKKLEAINEARRQIEEDPEGLRRSFLDQQKAKKKTTKSPPLGQSEFYRQITSEWKERKLAAVTMGIIDGLYSPESVTRVKSAWLLLRPVSIFPNQHANLPLNSLICSEGKAALQTLSYRDSVRVRHDPEEASRIIDVLNLPSGEKYGIFADVHETIKIPEGSRAFERLPAYPDILQPGWWYQVRGTADAEKDDRSVQMYGPPSEEPESLALIGCVPRKTALLIQENVIQQISTKQQLGELYVVKGGDSPIPPKYRHSFTFSDDMLAAIFSGYGSQEGNVLSPKLVPGQVLLATKPDGQNVMLGSIEHQAAEYF